jgi:tRNA-2-methylthio-N6-dimethylallyladenosine synthase
MNTDQIRRTYHITTYGCQMNVSDSRRLAAELERLGYLAAQQAEDADVIVLNTCVVRQQPEDRAVNRLLSLGPLKKKRPAVVIGLMGCLVGVKNPAAALSARFPFVDVLMPPSDPQPLLNLLLERDDRTVAAAQRTEQDTWQDGNLPLPVSERGQLVATYLPVVLGCSHACAYCVIPHRRGPERSRPSADIIAEAKTLAAQGIKEITLLGQIVDRYGLDRVDERINLAGLLQRLHPIAGIERIRFLTSHPNWLTDELLQAVAELPKVCEHIEVPIQSGDDEILQAMRRGYTVRQYRELVALIRRTIPGVSIHSDIIVGFPGETDTHFQRTVDLLAELRLDKVHIARYSPRPGTLSARTMADEVPAEEKECRRRALDDLQARIVGEINQQLLGHSVEVLVEEKQRHRWRGRTRGNKLVFFEDDRNLLGQLVPVHIQWAGPWSMVGVAADRVTGPLLIAR